MRKSLGPIQGFHRAVSPIDLIIDEDRVGRCGIDKLDLKNTVALHDGGWQIEGGLLNGHQRHLT